jgi:hypothetical protein
VARAVRSADLGERRWTQLAEIALRACRAAIDAAPRDPTPLVALLTLARLGHTPQVASAGSDEFAEVKGPWELLDQIRALDPFHREAHIRFLHCLGSDADRLHFAMHTANTTPLDADPQVVVLVALVEQYRSKSPEQRGERMLEGQWRLPRALQYSLDLHENWFPRARARRFAPITDYSYLAHALWAGDRTPQARDVFVAMGPYAASLPWSVFGNPETALLRARSHCHVGPAVSPLPGAG